jgi:hypothetical protein
MHEVDGDLLIGGARLRHIQIDLEEELPQPGTKDWKLAGHLHLTPEQSQQLQTDQPYRLQLHDGRAGQVVVSRIAPDGQPDRLLADFQPPAKRA